MKTIVVQISTRQWTMEAVHFASAMARSTDGHVVLLRLVLAHNPGLLGWDVATPPTSKEDREIAEYASIAEDYGVEFAVQPMQYISQIEALAQAAERLDADVLFAPVTQSSIPFWGRFRLWNLKRQLRGCQLYTLDEKLPPSVESAVSATAVLEHR